MADLKNIISTFQHVRQADGTFITVFPVNSINEVYYDIDKDITLADYLKDNTGSITVANDTERFNLTSENVKLMDVVYVEDTGKKYFVIDTDSLTTANGYSEIVTTEYLRAENATFGKELVPEIEGVGGIDASTLNGLPANEFLTRSVLLSEENIIPPTAIEYVPAEKIQGTLPETCVPAEVKKHTHELAGHRKLNHVTLLGITTTDNLADDFSILDNSISASSESKFIIDYLGYAELELSLQENEKCNITINGVTTELTANEKFTYSGMVNNSIEISGSNFTVTFDKFDGSEEDITYEGFMSAEDKEKIDRMYIDESGNAGFGDIETLDFYGPNGFGTGKNNVIGNKAFNILAIDLSNYTVTLDSVEGLAVDDTFNLYLARDNTNQIFVDIGKIAEINENTIKFIIDDENPDIPTTIFDQLKKSYLKTENDVPVSGGRINSLWVVKKPTCGTKNFGLITYAEGTENISSGGYSHVEGYGSIASFLSHAEGNQTLALNESHAEGYKTYAYGENSHAEGATTKSMGQNSHAEGTETVAKGISSHAQGYRTRAEGAYSHAEGVGYDGKTVVSSGTASHAEGRNTEASGNYSHSEGNITKAKGISSHAEGHGTEARGDNSHAEGIGAIATGEAQHVQGKYNAEDTEKKYAHIIGGGSNTKRKNIHTVDWDGNAWYEGVVSQGVDGDNNTLPGQTICMLENLPDLNVGELNVQCSIDGVDLEPGVVYSKKITSQYFGYIDIDNSDFQLSDGMYLFAYDMEILSASNIGTLMIGGHTINIAGKRNGYINYSNSKFKIGKYNHVYYPFVIDNTAYKKYGVYFRDTDNTNGKTNECVYKIHNPRIYKLNELTDDIKPFKYGTTINNKIAIFINKPTDRNILFDGDIEPDIIFYNDGTKNLIGLSEKLDDTKLNIYSISEYELNHVNTMASNTSDGHMYAEDKIKLDKLTIDDDNNLKVNGNPVAKRSESIELTLPVSDWVTSEDGVMTLTVSNEAITESTNGIVSPSHSITPTQLYQLYNCGIIITNQTTGSITFRAFDNLPTEDIHINILLIY